MLFFIFLKIAHVVNKPTRFFNCIVNYINLS